MELNYLWEFLILSETKSYSVAAQRLFLSEPTLSRHMKALEEDLDASLFERGTGGLELTEYGKALFPFAQKIVDDVNESRTAINLLKARHASALRITSGYPIRSLIEKFSQQNPDIFCNLADNNVSTVEILERLHSGELDLAVVQNAPEDSRLEKLHYTNDHYAAVMSVKHHLARRKRVRISELKNERFISFASDQECNNVLLRLCKSAGFEPSIVALSKNGVDAASITKYGGIAILMANTMKNNAHAQDRLGADIAIVDLEPREEVEISLVYPKDKTLSDNARRFIDFILDSRNDP